jgi:hypothetical protein
MTQNQILIFNLQSNFHHKVKRVKGSFAPCSIILCCINFVCLVILNFSPTKNLAIGWKLGRQLGIQFLMTQYNDFQWIEHFMVGRGFVFHVSLKLKHFNGNEKHLSLMCYTYRDTSCMFII